METYALFAAARASRIRYGFFGTDANDDRVQLAFPDIQDEQVQN